MILDKTTDVIALGLRGLGKGIEAAAPAIEATGKGIWSVGEKIFKWFSGSSSKTETQSPKQTDKD